MMAMTSTSDSDRVFPARMTPTDLFALFDRWGIAHSTVTHPPLFTVEQGREWHPKIPGLHCKNLFLRDDKGRYWLALLPADKRADLNRLRHRVGAPRFSFGRAEALLAMMGLTPGSVTPFGLVHDTARHITVIVDCEIVATESVNFHPLHNAASTTLRSADLLLFLRELGYTPLVVDCGGSNEERAQDENISRSAAGAPGREAG